MSWKDILKGKKRGKSKKDRVKRAERILIDKFGSIEEAMKLKYSNDFTAHFLKEKYRKELDLVEQNKNTQRIKDESNATRQSGSQTPSKEERQATRGRQYKL